MIETTIRSEVKTIPNRQMAEWMVSLLSSTYGRHNLSSSIPELEEQISKGVVVPFFTIESGQLANGAALIMGERTVEIGRAANAPGKNGGAKIMLQAVESWKRNELETRPLVSEIRMAAPFEGIAGGQGSQATLLGKVHMIPQAFLAAFHHPGPNGPDRQELFCFVSLEKEVFPIISPEELELPDSPLMNIDLLQILLRINGHKTRVNVSGFKRVEINVTQTQHVPFPMFVVNNQGVPIDHFPTGRHANSSFDLVVVPANHKNLGEVSQSLIENGFQCAGISAPHQGRLQLMFGRLDRTLLAPTEPMKNFPHIPPELIMKVDRQFRTL